MQMDRTSMAPGICRALHSMGKGHDHPGGGEAMTGGFRVAIPELKLRT